MILAAVIVFLVGALIGILGLNIWWIVLLSPIALLFGFVVNGRPTEEIWTRLLYSYNLVIIHQLGYLLGAVARSIIEVPKSNPRLRVLIAEDEILMTIQLEHCVEDRGHVCLRSVRSGPEAVQAALLHRPDAVIMDVRLANGTDGIEAAAEIRRRTGVHPVLLTAYCDAEMRARAEVAEPLAIMVKPIQPDLLAQILSLDLTRPRHLLS